MSVKIMQEVWDAVPREVKQDKDYVFVVGSNFKDCPKTFHGKDVYIDYNMDKDFICFMSNPYWEYPVYKVSMTEESVVECIVLTDKPDCGVMGITFKE